jgi:hypothetical protein
MMFFIARHPKATPEFMGSIPNMLSSKNPRLVREQLDAGYQHGGGWRPQSRYVMGEDQSLNYPNDPPLHPVCELRLAGHDERIVFYPYSIVAIIQPNGSFEACRMD